MTDQSLPPAPRPALPAMPWYEIILVTFGLITGFGATAVYENRTSSTVPEITIQSTAIAKEPNAPIKLTAQTTGKHVKWHAQDGLYLMPGQDDKIVWAMSPRAGTYSVWAWTGHGSQVSEAAECLVTVGTPTPPVPPTPPGPPTPPTPPAPVTQKTFAVMVFDENAMTPAIASLMHSSVAADLQAAGHTWRAYEAKSAKGSLYLSVTKHSAPCLVIVSLDGKVLSTVDPPKDSAGVLAAIKAVAG